MLNVTLDKETGIALLEPHGALIQSDFENAARLIDPYVEATGKLNGLIIYTEKFPGWDSFAALVSHLKFVKNHQHEIKKVAFVTDSALGNMAEHMGKHFIAAEIKHFDFQALEAAKRWVCK
ncbi:STAS/SEC14 domain-containing protein [Pontiellaceae bacterium B12219]|nr:STAS/SEC14 domain-containing protein [Pontiellaceae bacterium B12219]